MRFYANSIYPKFEADTSTKVETDEAKIVEPMDTIVENNNPKGKQIIFWVVLIIIFLFLFQWEGF